MESVEMARKSFEKLLANEKYAGIIRDDAHLEVILGLVDGMDFRSILDIGTGNGYLAFPLAEKFHEAEVIGIDIAENIMAANNERARETENLRFMAFDGVKYPFEKGSFDLIVSRYAFHHFPDAADCTRQMRELLAPGGMALIADPVRHPGDTGRAIDRFMAVKKDGHIAFRSSNELDEIFTRAGFEVFRRFPTTMKFPFPPLPDYKILYDQTPEEVRGMYSMHIQNDSVRVGRIEVANTVYKKQSHG